MQPTKSEAIKRFLTARTLPDLANRYSLEMECQVNVAQDDGRRIDGDFKGRQWHGYTNGISTWKPIRIPYNAATEPNFDDTIMNFDLDIHAEGIGMTGWNWFKKESIYVGFDFDAITGHSTTHKGKLTDKQLQDVQKSACEIPWVTLRRSTSGNGLHLYVEFEEPIETFNHTEHSALARSVIGMMSGVIGFDFHSKVDVCGGNMWVWHRKMKGTNGLTLIKQGDLLAKVPDNWRDHLNVIKNTRAKTLPAAIEESNIPEIDKLFNDLTGQRSNVQLDDQHKGLIKWLSEHNSPAYWDQDHWMLVCHTSDLKDAHDALNYRGVFETVTRKSSTVNCFAFPWRKGSWAVRRFSPGVQEHPSWSQDGAGWTQCYYNREPDLSTAAKSCEANEHKNGGFVFRHASDAAKAAEMLGVNIGELPPKMAARPAKMKEKDGRLIIEIDQEKGDSVADDFKGWIPEGKTWSRVFNANLKQPSEVEAGNYDDVLRHLVSEAAEDCGWTLNTAGVWIDEPITHVKAALQGGLGLNPKEVTAVVGGCIFKHWKLVNMPFQSQYPGDRKWNRNAAQFVFNQTENRDNLNYPTWLKVLTHSGQGLDEAVAANGWCKANTILNGADYLKIWVASLFQKPMEQLPYLFFYSRKQNTGKSIFAEALSLLVTKGVERADQALTNQNSFNGELARAILCLVEETDLSKSGVAYNRIKDWVTAKMFPVHTKGETPYSVPNSTHWIQTANDPRFCPVLTGDTRITVINVSPLEPHELIPKTKLLELLKKEAPDFMAEIMHLEIPQSNDRLNVPVIATIEKLNLERSNMTVLEKFLAELTHKIDGETIPLSELYQAFSDTLDPKDAEYWTKNRMSKEMPPEYPKGRLRGSNPNYQYGNISFEPRKPDEAIKPKLIVDGEYLTPIGEVT